MARFFGGNEYKASEKNFAAHYLHHMATHADLNHSVIHPGRTDKNAARPMHFNSLLNKHLLLWISNTVGNHPGRGASRSRAGSRIFAVVKHHSRVQPGRGVHGFARHEIKKLPAGLSQVLLRSAEIHS